MTRGTLIGRARATLGGTVTSTVVALGMLACRPVEPIETADDAPVAAVAEPATRLPPEYVLIGRAGATAWAQPPREGVPASASATTLGSGFGFVVTQQLQVGARRYLRLGDAGWVAAEQVNRARPSTFAGATIARGKPLNVGW